MKTKLFLVLVTLNLTLTNAQNWSVLPPSVDSLHFQDNGGIILSVIADSIFQASGQKIIYPQKEIQFFDSSQGNCDGKLNGFSWCGDVVYEQSGKTYFVFDDDSLLVSRVDSSTLSFFKYDTIQVIQVGKQHINLPNSVLDSVWIFQLVSAGSSAFSNCINGKQLIISKNQGLVSFPACFKEYRKFSKTTWSTKFLPGTVNQSNFNTPTVLDFFDYDIGDEMHYNKFTNGSSSNHSSETIWISRVTGRNQDSIGITYAFEDTGYVFNPISGTQWFGANYSITYSFSQFDFNFTGSIYKKANSNEAQIITNTSTELQLIGDMITIVGNCVDEYNYSSVYKSVQSKYEIGIGLTEEYEDVYLGYPSYTHIKYYSIKGVTWGTPYSIGMDENYLPDFKFFPNPASSLVVIECENGNNTPLTFEVVDITGRIVASGLVFDAEKSIDISNLNKGYYILRLNGFAPQSFIKI